MHFFYFQVLVKDYITIDVKSGKRVMLNDLVEINKEFIEHIQKSDIAKVSERTILSDDRDEEIWEYLKSIEVDDLLRKFEQCSLTQEQVIQDGYFHIENSIEALVFRNSFYLKNNSIIIVLQFGEELHITLHLDDIVDFLKVEKW